MIPQGWEEKTLGEICVIIAGQSPNSQFYNTEAKGLPFYQGKKEFTNKYIGAPNVWTTEITKEALAGDILMSIRAPVGPINYATEKCCIGRGLASIRNGKLISKDFLFYYLLSIQQKIGGHDGAVFNSISRNEISALKILLPPLPEQERIVAKLDEAFEAIDKVRANAEQNLNNAKGLFESALNKTFTENTEDWQEKTLKEISNNLDYKRIPITKNLRKHGIYPYYGASGIVDYVEGYIFDDTCLLISEDGANLLMRTYPIAFSVSGKYWVNNHAHVLKFNEMCTQRFVEFYLNNINLGDYITGAAQPKLTQNKLNEIPIPYPSLPEQQKIVEKLDSLREQTKNLEQIYAQKIKECDELKQSILQKAFRGEL